LKETLVTDFFGGVAQVEPLDSEFKDAYSLDTYENSELSKVPAEANQNSSASKSSRTKDTSPSFPQQLKSWVSDVPRAWAGVGLLSIFMALVSSRGGSLKKSRQA